MEFQPRTLYNGYKMTIQFRTTLLSWMVVAAACGNGGGTAQPAPPRSSEGEVAKTNTVEKGQPNRRSAPSPKRTDQDRAQSEPLFDFSGQLHRAHLRSGGLLIDFGTPGQHKYTLGNWRSGWRGAFVEQEVTYSRMTANTATLFFDLLPDEAGGGTIAFRGRAVGSDSARVYLNGEAIGRVQFPTDHFSHFAIKVEEGLRAGQNKILLRADRRPPGRARQPAALALDYLRVISHQAASGPAASSIDAVHFPDPKGGRADLVLTAGESLAYNLLLPPGARLVGTLRSRIVDTAGQLTISLVRNNKSTPLAQLEVGQQAAPIDSSLAAYSDQAVTLLFRADRGEVVLDNIALHRPVQQKPIASGKSRAKHLVLVLIDTLRADRLVFHNPSTRVQTPYLDKLANQSMVFERAFASENWTKPSIASLLSGLYPQTHLTKDDRAKLPKSVRMASEHLKAMGFTTAAFVANGYVSDKFGFKRGWDTWTNYVREGKANRARYVIDDAINWLDSRPPDKPFFLYVHTIDPHVPYIPPKAYWSRYDSLPYNGPVKPTQTAKLLEKVKTGSLKLSDRDKIRLEALYDGEISYHDDQLARLHDALERHGLLDDTLIVVTSDHGEEFFEHGLVGHGHSLYEELLHVPLMVRLPGAANDGGTRSTAEVNLADVFPTCCDILGVEPPADLEGESLVPQLMGTSTGRYPSVTFSEFLNSQRAARMGRYKVIYKGLNPLLFDLKTDTRETTDLAAERPAALALMRDALGLHLGSLNSPRPTTKAGKNHNIKGKRVHRPEEATIDPQTRKQLEALGYFEKTDPKKNK